MLTSFEEINLHVYHSILGLCLDLVIWCLGPLIDESRRYGVLRRCLAVATCTACRSWYGIHD